MKSIHSRDMFFVYGAPKSGTTWVKMLLNAHPQIYCRGEEHLKLLLEKLGELFTAYNKRITAMDKKTSDEGVELLDSHDGEAVMALMIERLLLKGQKEGITRLGLKDNEMIEQLGFYVHLFPQAKFIHVLRDPRDVVVSAWFHNVRVEAGFKEKYGNDMVSWVNGGLLGWAKAVREAFAFEDSRPKQCFTLRYEALKDDTQAHAKSLIAFLGLEPRDDDIATCVEATEFTRLAKQKNAKESEGFFRKGTSGDWQEHISGADIAETLATIAPILQRAGYE